MSVCFQTKAETPKYGLIYHASLIGQSAPKFKGKISRVLAAKCALSIRVDALGDTDDASLGLEARAKVEARLRQLEGKTLASDSVVPTERNIKKYEKPADDVRTYNADADAVPAKKDKKEKKEKKAKKDDDDEPKKKEKKAKKDDDDEEPKKKKKKAKAENGDADEEEVGRSN